MKKIFIYILVVFISISLSYSPKWYIETVDNTYCVGESTSIELDSNDHPHISYNEYNYRSELRYAYFDGSKWYWEIVDEDTGPGGYNSSLVLDKNDNPHIAYISNDPYNLKYAYFDSSKWNIEIIDTNNPTEWPFNYTSICLDSKGNPHISYYNSNGSDLKYAYFDGLKWNIEIVDSEGKVGWYTSIAIDSNDHPHISYDDETNRHLKYAYFDGTKWNIETVDDRIFTGRCTSIAIDKEDKPHIAYMGSPGLAYAYFDGTKWNIETVDNDHYGGHSSLSLDSNDLPHISYIYWTDDIKRLMYAYYDGKEWHIEIVDGDDDGFDTSIAIDRYDFPHISYADYDNLKYARYGYGLGITLTTFTAKPNNDAIILNWSISTDEDISGFNLYRRVVEPWVIHELPLQYSPVGTDYNLSNPVYTLSPVGENAHSPLQMGDDTQWTKVNTSLITGTNPYSYTDRDIAPETKYEYKLEAVISDKSEMLSTTQVTSGNGTPERFDITKIYPCPASDYINCVLSIQDAKVVNINIYDISGRLVSKSVMNVYNPGIIEAKIDTNELADGVYILNATSGVEKVKKHFVIVK